MSWLDRLRQAFTRPLPPSTAPPATTERADGKRNVGNSRHAASSESDGPPAEEAILQRLLQDLTGPVTGPRGGEFYDAVDQLVRSGWERGALEVLSRYAVVLPEDEELLLRLAELLCAQRKYVRAVPVLERLIAEARQGLDPAGHAPPERLLRARYLLSEAKEAQGDATGARTELELILCEDLDYPRARGRLEKLARAQAAAQQGALSDPPPAAKRGEGTAVQSIPTLLGAAGVRHQRYQLLRELGRGSAGTVYLAQDQELGRDLAIKIFHPAGRQAGGAERAWNEARLTAAVRHPGVVAVYELDDQRHMVVMELCTGGTLRQRIQGGRLRPEVALWRTRELLDTLQTVHRTGVVHGDLKPGNLLFRGGGGKSAICLRQEDGLPQEEETHYGDLVIADFGTARLLGVDPEDENGGQAHGTLGYLAPERRKNPAGLTPAADVYAIGAILLEMLIGSLPLSRFGMLRGDPLPTGLPGPVSAELSGKVHEVDRLLQRLLAPEPRDRPTASEAYRMLA